MTRFWSEIAGGFLGTMVLTTVLRAGSELGITRMDLPFLLGTAVTDRRTQAKLWGYVFHLVVGLVFALGYGALFVAVGRSGAVFGGALGVLHAVVVGTFVANVLLPIVHPRIGTSETAANDIALLEPPGFLMLNYGRNTFLLTLGAHIAYGAIVGWAFRA